VEGTVVGAWAAILAVRAQPLALPDVSRAMEQQQVPDTRPWMAAFLVLALTMIAIAIAWQAYGPPIR
jgi:hypothetical protein